MLSSWYLYPSYAMQLSHMLPYATYLLHATSAFSTGLSAATCGCGLLRCRPLRWLTSRAWLAFSAVDLSSRVCSACTACTCADLVIAAVPCHASPSKGFVRILIHSTQQEAGVPLTCMVLRDAMALCEQASRLAGSLHTALKLRSRLSTKSRSPKIEDGPAVKLLPDGAAHQRNSSAEAQTVPHAAAACPHAVTWQFSSGRNAAICKDPWKQAGTLALTCRG